MEGVEAATADLPIFRQILPLAHSGFLEAYNEIRHELQDAVQSALLEAGPRARLYLTGHSLGGALATLAALDLHLSVAQARAALAATRGFGTRATRGGIWGRPSQSGTGGL